VTKYRIVERNRDVWGEYRSYPCYYLQVKIFDWFWIDYRKCPFADSNRFNSYSYDLELVEKCYQVLMEKQGPFKQTVVKTFYDETT
jgi:hypothetical protein